MIEGGFAEHDPEMVYDTGKVDDDCEAPVAVGGAVQGGRFARGCSMRSRNMAR